MDKKIIEQSQLARALEIKAEHHLTIRQHFAFEIFKKIWDSCEADPEPYDPNNTMQMRAVSHTDELIKALNEEKEDV